MEVLGVRKEDLLLTSHCIKGITGRTMNILGALLANITSQDKFTSDDVCLRGGLRSVAIPHGFVISTASKSNCNCLKRAPMPLLPAVMPYSSTDENRARLEA